MSIAGHYGRRLLRNSRNVDPDALGSIMSEYPSHGFVIDRYEAKNLFDMVREPEPLEVQLADRMGLGARWPRDWQFGSRAPFRFLSTEQRKAEVTTSDKTMEESDNAQLTGPAGDGRGDTTEESREKPAAGDGNGEIVPASNVTAELSDLPDSQ